MFQRVVCSVDFQLKTREGVPRLGASRQAVYFLDFLQPTAGHGALHPEGARALGLGAALLQGGDPPGES